MSRVCHVCVCNFLYIFISVHLRALPSWLLHTPTHVTHPHTYTHTHTHTHTLCAGGLMRKPETVEKRLRWQAETLKKPLHARLGKKIVNDAVQLFPYIMAYMVHARACVCDTHCTSHHAGIISHRRHTHAHISHTYTRITQACMICTCVCVTCVCVSRVWCVCVCHVCVCVSRVCVCVSARCLKRGLLFLFN